MNEQQFQEQRLRLLFAGWLSDRLEPEQEIEFLQLFADPDLDAARQELIAQAYEELPLDFVMEDDSAEALFRRIRAGARPPRVRFLPVAWARIAAAILVLLAGAGTWYAISRKPAEKTNPALAITDIAPGGNKAILTLSNGQKIILDSAHTGLIAQQGNASIQKIANDQVAYSGRVGGDKKNISYNMLSTPKGGQYQLILPDGTKVWLNAASSITYPTAFTGNERRVSMTGEAYFEVVHNSRQPFRVQAGQTTLEDLGTAFNVNAYADEPSMKTTLVEGALKVGSLRLAPGQQADIAPNGSINLIRDADLQQATAWKNGEFFFAHTGLDAILRQVSRWYDLDIRYPAPTAANKDQPHLSGIISRNTPVSGVLRLLESNGARFTLKGKTLIVQ